MLPVFIINVLSPCHNDVLPVQAVAQSEGAGPAGVVPQSHVGTGCSSVTGGRAEAGLGPGRRGWGQTVLPGLCQQPAPQVHSTWISQVPSLACLCSP